jgi:hypothetical protein
MITLHAKSYYPNGAYPVLFAGGAVALEAWLTSPRLRAALLVGVVLFSLPLVPFVVPILPIERVAAYQSFLGLRPGANEKGLAVGRLSQLYADMFGWRELAALVGRAYQSLSPEERADAVFFANNFGEAAAVDIFGKPWGLPPSISAHNNYYLWGPRRHIGDVVIQLGGAAKTCSRSTPQSRQWAKPITPGHFPLRLARRSGFAGEGSRSWMMTGRN